MRNMGTTVDVLDIPVKKGSIKIGALCGGADEEQECLRLKRTHMAVVLSLLQHLTC